MSVRPKLDASGHAIPKEWIIDVRLHGAKSKRERIPFHGSEQAARQFEITLRQGDQPSVATMVSPTFHDSLPEFLRDYGNLVSKGTLGDFQWAWKRLSPVFGCVPMRNLTPALVERYKAERLEAGVKKRTINRELSYLGAIVRWAEERKIIPPLVTRIKRFPKKQTISPVPVIHTPEEIAAVIEQVNPKYRCIVLLLYDAGLRRKEATTLKGEQVDLARGILRIVGKGNKERQIPIITPRLHDALKDAIKKAGKGHLFLNPRTKRPVIEIRGTLEAAAHKAGVDKKIYHHLLRHNHATHSAVAGVDMRAVQQMLGHASSTTTAIYTHLAGDFLKTEGSKFAALQQSLGPPSKKSPAKPHK